MSVGLIEVLARALVAQAPAHECDLDISEGAVARDDRLLDAVTDGTLPSGFLRVWRQSQCIALPRRFAAHPRFRRAAARSAGEGWPVVLRASGGTAVALHAGILNVSLFGLQPPAEAALDEAYSPLIALLSGALGSLGLAVDAGPVDGASCDGRFNLRWRGRKLAGTAAAVRVRRGRVGRLVHASLAVQADLDMDVRAVTRVESALGIAGTYCRRAHATVAEALARVGDAAAGPRPYRETVPA